MVSEVPASSLWVFRTVMRQNDMTEGKEGKGRERERERRRRSRDKT